MQTELNSSTCKGSRAREDDITVCDIRYRLPCTCSSDVATKRVTYQGLDLKL